MQNNPNGDKPLEFSYKKSKLYVQNKRSYSIMTIDRKTLSSNQSDIISEKSKISQIDEKKYMLKELIQRKKQENFKTLSKQINIFEDPKKVLNYKTEIQGKLQQLKLDQKIIQEEKINQSMEKLIVEGKLCVQLVQENYQKDDFDNSAAYLKLRDYIAQTEKYKFQMNDDLKEVLKKCIKFQLDIMQQISKEIQNIYKDFYKHMTKQYDQYLVKYDNIQTELVPKDDEDINENSKVQNDQIIQDFQRKWDSIWISEISSEQINEIYSNIYEEKEQVSSNIPQSQNIKDTDIQAEYQNKYQFILEYDQSSCRLYYEQITEFLQKIIELEANSISKEDQGLQKKGITLGAGAFGEVREVIDFEDKQIYAGKEIKQKNIFKEEKKAYERLSQIFQKDELAKSALGLIKSNDISNTLYFELGMCSLEEYSKEVKTIKNTIDVDIILYIFKTCVLFIIQMMEHGLIHGDIKPANFQIIMDENRKKMIKFIDFGGAGSSLIPTAFTPIFYMHPYLQQKDGNPVIQNFDERLSLEIYQLYRSIQQICLLDSEIKLFDEEKQQIDDLLQIQKALEKRYFNEQQIYAKDVLNLHIDDDQDQIQEQDKDKQDQLYLQRIFQFFRYYILENKNNQAKIDFNKLFLFCKEMKITEEIIDKEKICDKIVIQKRKMFQKETDFVQIFFGLQGYLPLQVKYSQSEENQALGKNILQEAELFAQNKKDRVMVILADAGCGKSLSLIQIQQLYQKKRVDNILVKMNQFTTSTDTDFFGKQNLNEEIEKRIEQIKSRYKLIDKYQMIFLMDGYDEYDSKQENFVQEIFKMQDNPYIKFIITSRIEYQNDDEINQNFSSNQIKPIKLYLKTFDDTQQWKFIHNFIENSKKMQDQFVDVGYKFYDDVEQYQRKFQEFALSSLTRVPQSLQLILVSLKKLVDEEQQKISQFSIYKEFIEQHQFKELKRNGKQFEKELYQNYKVEVEENDLLDYELVETIIEESYM